MSETYDMVVIGAGIHGAGIAQAAAARGWSVLVVDKGEVASGTSSKSSKLIHGGLRYLETFQLKLVYECLRERRLLLRNAPDLVELKPFYIPVYRDSRRHPLWIRLGLMLYAILGGLGPYARFASLPKGEWPRLDGLNTQNLVRVFRYYDAQTDDAVLTRAVMSSAESLGAQVLTRTPVTRIVCHDHFYQVFMGNNHQSVRCRAVVNAAGPWANQVAACVEPKVPRLPVDLVQGAHIVLDFAAPGGCYYLESTDDGRAVFALPWYGKMMVGTTETFLGEVPDRCMPLDEEVTYLLRVFNTYFPGFGATSDNILKATAGIRVLPKADSASAVAHTRSRETQFVMVGGQPQYLAVYGGKLTSYRATAERVVKKLATGLPARKTRARTDQLQLV